MTIQLADGRKTFLDFREKAPLAATPNMYLDASGNVVKGASTKGHLAVGVPGTVAGLEYAREKYGTRSRGALIAPAISFAKRGFALDEGDIIVPARITQVFSPMHHRPPIPVVEGGEHGLDLDSVDVETGRETPGQRGGQPGATSRRARAPGRREHWPWRGAGRSPWRCRRISRLR